MDKTVVIVESPAKAKTINQYLGKDYIVLSSIGHIRDLTLTGEDNLGVDIKDDFKPSYGIIKGKEKVVARLKKETQDRKVLIATDPDREGEAIGWHLAQILDLDVSDENRIVFNEITKYAINEAIDKPRKIDLALVNSQETRRILDRVIGFKLSGLLRDKINSYSAGRVQSVALKLIVDLEEEIKNFKPTSYFHLKAKLGDLVFNHIKNEDKEIKTKEEAELIKNNSINPFEIVKLTSEEKDYYPKPAYITATLQQDGIRLLNMSSYSVMKTAGSLYEGVKIGKRNVGLITYMRTDSVRLSPMYINLGKEYIKENFGEEYVGTYGYNRSRGGGNVQDAHEAIRPTDLRLTPAEVKEHLTKEQFKLYEMIFERFIAANMKPAKYSQTNISIESNKEVYEVTNEKLLFDGFHKVITREKRTEHETPKLVLGENISIDEVTIEELETKPPYRYNEASLIRELEQKGIGRPSTYSTIIQTLKNRQYVRIMRRSFFPTEQGILTSKSLDQFFANIINTDYTSQMEQDLDDIAEGSAEGIVLLKDFYSRFEPVLDKAKKEMKKVRIEPEKVDKDCPLCGSPLVVRTSRFGKFLGCSTFPKCKHIEDYKEEKQEEKKK